MNYFYIFQVRLYKSFESYKYVSKDKQIYSEQNKSI